MTLEEMLALLPDNTTGEIDAADMRIIVTELWNRIMDVPPPEPFVGLHSLNVGANMLKETTGQYTEEDPFIRVRSSGTVQRDFIQPSPAGGVINGSLFSFRYGTTITVNTLIEAPDTLTGAQAWQFYDGLGTTIWPLGKPAHPVTRAHPVFAFVVDAWNQVAWVEIVADADGFSVNVLSDAGAFPNNAPTRLYAEFTFDTSDAWPADIPSDGSGMHIPAPPVDAPVTTFSVNGTSAPGSVAVPSTAVLAVAASSTVATDFPPALEQRINGYWTTSAQLSGDVAMKNFSGDVPIAGTSLAEGATADHRIRFTVGGILYFSEIISITRNAVPPAVPAIDLYIDSTKAPRQETINVGETVVFEGVLTNFSPAGNVTLQWKDHGASDATWVNIVVLTLASAGHYSTTKSLYYDLGQDYQDDIDYRVTATVPSTGPIYSPVYTIFGV